MQDFVGSSGGDFVRSMAGQGAFLYSMTQPLGSFGGTIGNIVSISGSLHSARSSMKTISQFSLKAGYSAGSSSYFNYTPDHEMPGYGKSFQPTATVTPMPTIYFVDFPVYSKNLNWQKVVDAMLALINLNQLGEYSIVKISQEDTYKMMQNGGIQPQDAILGIRDGESIKEWGLPGISVMDSGTGAASWKQSFVSPTIATEKSRIFKKVGINLSKEEMFAIFALHEVLHQDIQRMHWNVMGQRIQNSFPSIMPHSKGHNNSAPNLMMDGTEWINYALEHPQELHKLKQLLPETYGYVKAYKFGTYIGLTTTTEWRNLLNVIDVLIKR